MAADGGVYVAEAGLGGDESFQGPPAFGTSSRGPNGKIIKVAPDGTKTDVATGLPSIALGGFEVVGLARLIEAQGALWAVTGFVHEVVTQQPNESAVLRIDPGTGTVTLVADIGAYERANDPDGFGVESDLNGLALGKDGMLYVADAGGNTLYRVNPTTGAISLVTVFAGLPGQGENPARGGRSELDPVPTSVAVGADGTVYVGLLGGFPFPSGSAKVVRVAADGTVSDAVTGFTLITGLEIGPDGLLYVVEFASGFNLTTEPPSWNENTGRVVRIAADGSKQVVIDGLNGPFGITFNPAGDLFVTNNSNTVPQAGAQGSILRVNGVAASQNVSPPSAPTPSAPAAPATLPNTGVGDPWDLRTLLLVVLGLALIGTGAAAVRHRNIWTIRTRAARDPDTHT